MDPTGVGGASARAGPLPTKPSQLRTGLKAQVHSVLGKEGLLPPISHLWGPGGSVWLDDTEMADAYENRVRSLRRLIKLYDTEGLQTGCSDRFCIQGPPRL